MFRIKLKTRKRWTKEEMLGKRFKHTVSSKGRNSITIWEYDTKTTIVEY